MSRSKHMGEEKKHVGPPVVFKKIKLRSFLFRVVVVVVIFIFVLEIVPKI